MTTEELIDITRRVIELHDSTFNIISNNKKSEHYSWGVEIIIKNIIITLNAVVIGDNTDTSIKLAYRNDKLLNNGEVIGIPVKSEKIDYSVYQEITNMINRKLLRTEDDVVNELKSIFRENTINNILNV